MAASFSPIVCLRRIPVLLSIVVAAFALAGPAVASVGVGSNAAAPALRVDAKGNAEISYTEGGAKKTVLVPKTGAVLYGGKLVGAGREQGGEQPVAPVREGAPQRAGRVDVRAPDVADAERAGRAPLLALARARRRS